WLMMSLWDALRMNMMISYQELVRTFPKKPSRKRRLLFFKNLQIQYLGNNLHHCRNGKEDTLFPDSSE
ncbi:hypothetical protein M8Q16_22360, partial [Enterobacter hormaechei]|nr:hypothetical protein [Enterobacter hormaechei]